MDDELIALRRKLDESPDDADTLRHYRTALERAGRGWFHEPLEPELRLGAESPHYIQTRTRFDFVFRDLAFQRETPGAVIDKLARRVGPTREAIVRESMRLELAAFLLDQLEWIEHSLRVHAPVKYGEGNDEYDSDGDVDLRMEKYKQRDFILAKLGELARGAIVHPSLAHWRQIHREKRATAKLP